MGGAISDSADIKGRKCLLLPRHIPKQMDALFEVLQRGVFHEGISQEEFLEKIAAFLGELNAIHPFREGNGRAQLAFVGLIGTTYGHPFQFEKLNRESFLSAMIDSYSGKRQGLVDELRSLFP